ncbi:MAG: alpha/beta hydrolase [Betaproteobacteria bacterium]|nr:alpha/beta hydrolase [Betaproteobacteria bacterium]
MKPSHRTLQVAFLTALLFVLTACGGHTEKEQRSSAAFGGVHVSYLDTGKKDAQTLVFIHGWSSDTSFWRFQVSEFSRDYRVLVLDLPGFGRSGKPQDVAYTMRFFAGAVQAVLADAGVQNPVLIGHSMGYAIVRQYLIDYPGTVKAVVNVDGAHFQIPPTLEEKKKFEDMVAAMLAAHEGPNREAAVRGFVETTFYGRTAPELQKEIMATVFTADPYAATSSLREMLRMEQWEERSFEVPSLAIYAKNKNLPPNHGDYLRTVFPNLTYVEWDDIGHHIMLEVPTRFNAVMRDYLESLPR